MVAGRATHGRRERLQEPTEELIEDVRAGKADAWSRVDARFRPILALILRGRLPALVRRRFDTQDVVQSALFTAFREIDSYEYRGAGSFKRWLVTILRNKLHQRNRDQLAAMRDAQRERELADAEDGALDAGGSSSPPEQADRAEQLARLLEALSELPDDERRIVVARVLDGVPLARIALELGLSESTVRRKLEKAFRYLKKRMSG